MTIVTVLAAAGLVVAAASVVSPRSKAQPPSDQHASSKQPVFVCRLDGLTSEERKQQRELRATLEQGTAQVTEDAEGYTFHYTAAVAPSTVIAWVEMERKCCPFLRFTLDMAEEGGPARLRVSGALGAKAFIATEMQISGLPLHRTADVR